MWPPDVEYLKLLINGLILGLCTWLGVRIYGKELQKTKQIISLFFLAPLFLSTGALYRWLWGNMDIWAVVLLLEITPGMAFIGLGYVMLVLGIIGVIKKLFRTSEDDA